MLTPHRSWNGCCRDSSKASSAKPRAASDQAGGENAKYAPLHLLCTYYQHSPLILLHGITFIRVQKQKTYIAPLKIYIYIYIMSLQGCHGSHANKFAYEVISCLLLASVLTYKVPKSQVQQISMHIAIDIYLCRDIC